MATPKEAAVMWLKQKLGEVSCVRDTDATELERLIQQQFPQYKLTDSRLQKIRQDVEKQAERVASMFEPYLKSRGIR